FNMPCLFTTIYSSVLLIALYFIILYRPLAAHRYLHPFPTRRSSDLGLPHGQLPAAPRTGRIAAGRPSGPARVVRADRGVAGMVRSVRGPGCPRTAAGGAGGMNAHAAAWCHGSGASRGHGWTVSRAGFPGLL